MSKVSARDRRAFDTLDRIYARLPRVACRRLCGDACGALPLTDLEARRLQVTTHRKPKTIPLADLNAHGHPKERCVYLDARGQCGAYAARPLICRVWGVLKMLSCPHGCVPDRWMDDLEFLHAARAVERVGGGRVIRTAPEGLVCVEGESYSSIPLVGIRSQSERDRNAEMTRALRAMHGGRIIAAVGDPHADRLNHIDLDKDT